MEADKGSDTRKAWMTKLETISAVLLLLATVSSAFCVYQATVFSGVQGVEFSEASKLRTESVRYTGIYVGQVQLDVSLWTEWLKAVNGNDTLLADFLEERFRDEFIPAFEAWSDLAEGPGDIPPGTPFDLPEYHLEAQVTSEELEAQAADAFERGKVANEVGDDYILATVLFASVMFLAGFRAKWTDPRVRTALIVTGLMVFAFTLTLIAGLPVKLSF